jgi:hypothetical protein
MQSVSPSVASRHTPPSKSVVSFATTEQSLHTQQPSYARVPPLCRLNRVYIRSNRPTRASRHCDVSKR